MCFGRKMVDDPLRFQVLQDDEGSGVQSETRLQSLVLVLEGEAFNEVYMTQDAKQQTEAQRELL